MCGYGFVNVEAQALARRSPVAAVAAAAGVVTIGGSSAGAAEPGWTSARLLVAADNNLEPFAIPNLTADGLRSAVARVSTSKGGEHRPFSEVAPTCQLGNLGNWSGAKVVQVNKGSFTEEQNLGNVVQR